MNREIITNDNLLLMLSDVDEIYIDEYESIDDPEVLRHASVYEKNRWHDKCVEYCDKKMLENHGVEWINGDWFIVDKEKLFITRMRHGR